MTKDTVIFQIDGQHFPKPFEKEKLTLGKILYVRLEKWEDILVKELFFNGSEKYAIIWIAPSNWTVTLIKDYQPKSNLVNLTIEQLDGYLDSETIKEKLNLLSSKLRIEHLYKSKEFENSALKNVFAVTERLYMLQKLKNEDASKALFFYWESIFTYHLLTCFDILGQPCPWIDFDAWLISNEFSSKKENYFAALTDKEDLSLSSKELYNLYKQEYGVKNAFCRFIKDILPPEARQELISSVEFTICDNPPKGGSHVHSEEDIVIKFLFEYRNTYTHKARFHYGINSHPKEFIPSWTSHEQIVREEEWISIKTHNWPTIIEKTVKIGLAEFLKNVI